MNEVRFGRKQKTVITVISKIAERQALPASCLVVIYGQDLGRRFLLDRPEVTVGRAASCEILLDQDSVSRQHAVIRSSLREVTVKDLGSTNGSYVNDELVQERALRDGDLVKIGRTIFKYLSGTNIEASYHEEIYRLTTVDGLTQTFNRRYLYEQLARELSRSTRYSRPLSLVLFDIDEFGKLNHDYGHLAGDSVLAQMAGLVRKNIRREDVLARLNGDEFDGDVFAFLLPETDGPHARQFAEKVRRIIETHTFTFEGTPLKTSISMGISAGSGGAELPPPDVFMKVATDNVAVSKRLGRNRVAG
ncbi:MAG: diguanylate cyclase [Deltaproteobacteria bacterium]|nr:diguanylate cyclase [Deltaproteobacteria bacterium]